MLEQVFDVDDIELIKRIANIANSQGISVYLIGGIVRDILLGKKPKDVDIVVVGDVISLVPFFKDKMFCKILKIQKDLKTVQIEFNSKLVIDFASTRKEIYEIKKGIPVAAHFGCSLKDDVLRRDFSINSIALSLNEADFEKIVDYNNGLEDLKNKKLRILHDKSFLDDPTRIIRAFKFAKRLNFTLEEKTEFLLKDYLEKIDYNESISLSRIKKELYSVFSLKSSEIIKSFIEEGIYKIVSKNINQNDFDKIEEIIDKYDIKENIPIIYFLAIFFNEENFSVIRRFELTRFEIKIIQDLKFTKRLEGFLTDLEIHQLYSKRTKESLVVEYLLKNNSNLIKFLDELSKVKIEVTSEDLLMMGVPESKSFSLIFNKLLESKIKGELPDKISELRFVRKLLMDNEV